MLMALGNAGALQKKLNEATSDIITDAIQMRIIAFLNSSDLTNTEP